MVQAGNSLENCTSKELPGELMSSDFEGLYDVITRLLDDLSEKSEENYYILSHYCDEKETIDFGKTKIYYYKYFENHFGLEAPKTSEEIANDLGGEWTSKGVEFRYQVVIEEDLNCNIMIKKVILVGFYRKFECTFLNKEDEKNEGLVFLPFFPGA